MSWAAFCSRFEDLPLPRFFFVLTASAVQLRERGGNAHARERGPRWDQGGGKCKRVGIFVPALRAVSGPGAEPLRGTVPGRGCIADVVVVIPLDASGSVPLVAGFACHGPNIVYHLLVV